VSMNAISDAIVRPFCVPGTSLGADDGQQERSALHSVATTAAVMESFAAARPDAVAHVRYADLMADPVGTVTSTLTTFDLDVEDHAAERVRAFLAHQRAGRRPPPERYEHSYTVEDVWSEPVISSYCATFGVHRERQRIVEPSQFLA